MQKNKCIYEDDFLKETVAILHVVLTFYIVQCTYRKLDDGMRTVVAIFMEENTSPLVFLPPLGRYTLSHVKFVC